MISFLKSQIKAKFASFYHRHYRLLRESMGVYGHLFDDVFREFVFSVSKRSGDDTGGLSRARRKDESICSLGRRNGRQSRRSGV